MPKADQRANPGRKAALTRRRKAAARKAVDTKRRQAAARKERDCDRSLVSSADLRLFHLPPTNAPMDAVHEFGRSYEGYLEAGSSQACAAIANERR